MPEPRERQWYTHGWNQDLSWKLLLGIVPRIPRILRPPFHFLATLICFMAMPNERRAASRNLDVIRKAAGGSRRLASFRLFYNFSKFMVAYVDLPPYGKGLGDDRVSGREEGRRVVAGALGRGRGLIVVGAHLGQWDVALTELTRMGVGITVVMRREDEESSRFAAAARHAAGLKVVFAGEDPFMLVGLLATLRRNEIVAVQGDRLYGRKPVGVTMFGKRAEIPRGPFDLAQASGAPLLPAAALFEGHGRYRLVFGRLVEAPAPRHAPSAPGKETISAEHHLAAGLEALVGEAPEQWFNFYDFWPEGLAPAAAGAPAPPGEETAAAGGQAEARHA